MFSGLELLATAVVALDEAFVVRYANPAAESLLATGAKSLIGQPFLALFAEREALAASLREARTIHWDYAAQKGMRSAVIDEVVALVDAQLEVNRRASQAAVGQSARKTA